MSTPPSRLVEGVEEGVAALGQTLPAGAAARLARLLLMLEHWNARINLTAVRDPQEMIAAHVLDSLSIRGFLGGRRIADVGTGAGFPGLPLAIAEPGRELELIDSHGRKIAFVRQALAELAIPNARAVQARAESCRPEPPFDSVCVRALGTLEEVVSTCGHLVAGGGLLLAMKGRYPQEELSAFERSAAAAAWRLDVSPLRVPGLEAHARHLVRLRRVIA